MTRRHHRRARPGRDGFTLIETLAGVAIIGVMIALLLPAVQAARESSRRLHCSANLKQLALACHNYAGVHGTFPIGKSMMFDPDPALDFFGEAQSFFVSILGQLDQQPLYNAANFSRSVFASVNSTIYAAGLEVLWCPSDPTVRMAVEYPLYEDPPREPIRFTSYAGCTGTWHADRSITPGPVPCKQAAQINGMFIPNRGASPAEISDGAGQTMLLGERAHGLLTGDQMLSTRAGSEVISADSY